MYSSNWNTYLLHFFDAIHHFDHLQFKRPIYICTEAWESKLFNKTEIQTFCIFETLNQFKWSIHVCTEADLFHQSGFQYTSWWISNSKLEWFRIRWKTYSHLHWSLRVQPFSYRGIFNNTEIHTFCIFGGLNQLDHAQFKRSIHVGTEADIPNQSSFQGTSWWISNSKLEWFKKDDEESLAGENVNKLKTQADKRT